MVCIKRIFYRRPKITLILTYYLRFGLEPVSFDPIPPMQILYAVILLGRYLSEHACRCWKVLACAVFVVVTTNALYTMTAATTAIKTIDVFFVNRIERIEY